MQTSLLTLALIVSSFAVGPVLSAQVPQIINYQGRIAVSDVNFEGEGQFKFALVNGGEDLAAQALASAQLVNGFVIGATITDAGLGYLATPTVTINGAGTGATATATVDAGVVTGITILTAGSGYTEGGTTIVIDGPSENLIYSSYWSNDGSSAAGDEPTDSVTLSVVKGLYSVLLGDDTITNMTPIPASVFANPDVRLRVWFDDGTANGSQLLTPDQRIASVGYAMMAGDVPNGSITSNKLAAGAVTADKIAAGSFTEGLAAEGSVIVASGLRSDLVGAGFFQVGTLAETNLWGETDSTNAPAARSDHTAVWTGSEMIIWGGDNDVSFLGLNTGARYNPSTDTWTATSLINAPAARSDDTAVWTGTEVIIWGGEGDPAALNTGARYDPSTDTWSSTSLINAPDGRSEHTAVWTGSEMIIWGGENDVSFLGLNTGARYNPSTDTWTATSLINAPAARSNHTAVWTGTEMIIWGGEGNTGARYNPSTDTWTATSLTNAPAGRYSPTAVWTGSEMIIWGGSGNLGSLNSGARYNPSTDTWSSTSLTNAPEARSDHTAVWTGTEMIIWGGATGGATPSRLNTGARYNPSTDTWSTTSLTSRPDGRFNHTAVWTGTEMIIWGGFDSLYSGLNTGGIYRPGEALYFYLKP
jgi:N-acetylneuraminic acid mutarotase